MEVASGSGVSAKHSKVSEWINLDTGEVSEVYVEGWEEIEKPDNEEESEADWLPDYYMKKLVQIKARREVIKAQTERLLSALDSEERALDWRYKARLEAIAEEQSKALGKRHVDYIYGRAQFRKGTKTTVEDEQAAIKWSAVNCPRAIKVETKTKLLRGELPKNKEIPGVKRETSTKFSVSFPK